MEICCLEKGSIFRRKGIDFIYLGRTDNYYVLYPFELLRQGTYNKDFLILRSELGVFRDTKQREDCGIYLLKLKMLDNDVSSLMELK